MNPFITFREFDNDGNLQYFILQRDFPHYVGYISPIPKNVIASGAPIMNYNLWVNFWGTIRGRFAPTYQNAGDEIGQIMFQMGEWFYQHRIMQDEKKYKKYKIPKDVPKPTE